MDRLVGGIVLFLIGFVGFVVARIIARQAKASMPVVGSKGGTRAALARVAGLAGLAVSALALFLVASSFVRIVPANTVGIPTTFGKVGAPMTSGFHITEPWTEITQFSTRIQELSMLRATDEGDKAKDDSISVIAKGGGSMAVDVTVRFAIAADKASELFKQAGSVDLIKDRFVRPDTREVVRDVFGQYTAEEGYSTLRGEIASQITDSLRDRLAARGVLLDSVNIRDVAPEQQVLDSINAVLKTRNEAAQAKEAQAKQVTEAETRRQVAEKDKEATVLRAQAEAQAVEIAAAAQAKANGEIAASLTPDLVQLEIAKACADAIAKTGAQVVNVCANAAASGATAAPTSVIVDSRQTAPAPAPPTTTP